MLREDCTQFFHPIRDSVEFEQIFNSSASQPLFLK